MSYLGTDSGDYVEILAAAAMSVDMAKVPGLSVEVGLREGGGTHHMIVQYNHPRTHIAIDPYGSLPYEWQENTIAPWVYDNEMRNNAVAALFQLTNGTNVNFVFLNMMDSDYFELFAKGYPLFVDGKRVVENRYAIVHLDAIHALHAIERQVEFFAPRISPNGMLVFDDIEGFYNHAHIEQIVLEKGFVRHAIGTKKASYRKLP